MFKKLFGQAPAIPAKQQALVRNITLGRTVSLDPLAWRRLGEETRFELDRDALTITAQGRVTLDGGQFVHRFYTDDHIMLQAMSDDETGDGAYDFTLFTPWSSAYPPDARARRVWNDRLSGPVFRGAENELPDYPRFWFAESDATQPPVTLWEDVFDARDATVPCSRIFQTCMLYARDLSDGRELMLAIEQQPEGGEVTHEIMIGIPLEMAEFSA